MKEVVEYEKEMVTDEDWRWLELFLYNFVGHYGTHQLKIQSHLCENGALQMPAWLMKMEE